MAPSITKAQKTIVFIKKRLGPAVNNRKAANNDVLEYNIQKSPHKLSQNIHFDKNYTVFLYLFRYSR
ncbi:hypothetical protein D3C71_1911650 [compost metagenome]